MKVLILILFVGVALAAPGHDHGRERRNIKEFLDEMLKETGIIDLLPWIQEKIKTDPDSERVIEFFKSAKWTNIKNHLKSCPGYEATNEKLKKEGIDLVELLEDIKKFVVGSSSRFQARRPLGEHLNEFLEKLDLDSLLVIVQEKLDGNPDMKKIVGFLNSKESKQIEECMKENDDVQDLIEELYNEGVDVKKLVDMFKTIFEVTRYSGQSRNVADMLEGLVKETGLYDLLEWLQQTITNDPDVQRIIQFFRGDEWKAVKAHLQQCPNYEAIKQKMKGEGIDINQILDGIKNFVIGQSRSGRKSLGELLNGVLSKLDIDRIMVAIQIKLNSDPDMKKLVDFLGGDDFKAVVDCMRQSQQVKDLVAELKDEGIDIVRLFHVLKTIFGPDD